MCAEMRAATLQCVRQISGFRSPSKADTEAFEQAVAEITASTDRLPSAVRQTTPEG